MARCADMRVVHVACVVKLLLFYASGQNRALLLYAPYQSYGVCIEGGNRRMRKALVGLILMALIVVTPMTSVGLATAAKSTKPTKKVCIIDVVINGRSGFGYMVVPIYRRPVDATTCPETWWGPFTDSRGNVVYYHQFILTGRWLKPRA